MKKQMTKAETIAECFRMVSEHEHKLPPYERALFLQRLDRRLSARTRAEIESKQVDGGCVVLSHPRFRKTHQPHKKPRRVKGAV